MPVRASRLQLPGKLIEPGCRRRTPSQLIQTETQQVLEARRRKLAQLCQDGRVAIADTLPILLGKFAQQLIRLAKMARCLCQRSRSRRKTRRHHRQYLVAKEIPGMPGVRITLVLDPRQRPLAGICLQFGTGDAQQGAKQTLAGKPAFGRHGGHTAHPASAQQIEKQCFRLIITMLRKQQGVGIGPCITGITSLARSRFKAERAMSINLNPMDLAGNTQSTAQIAAKGSPAIRLGRNTVMDMQGRKPPCETQSTQEMQQNHRITPTRESNAEAFIRRQPGGEKIADPGRQVS